MLFLSLTFFSATQSPLGLNPDSLSPDMVSFTTCPHASFQGPVTAVLKCTSFSHSSVSLHITVLLPTTVSFSPTLAQFIARKNASLVSSFVSFPTGPGRCRVSILMLSLHVDLLVCRSLFPHQCEKHCRKDFIFPSLILLLPSISLPGYGSF